MQPTTASPVNVQQLRQTAKQRYARGQGQRNLKGYSRLGKAALLSKLGLHDEARAHKSQATRRKAIAFNATKEGGDSSVRKAQVKGRILRSIKRAMTAKEKSLGRELTQQEKRAIAAKALAVEVKAIRSGKPEMKPKRGNAQNLKPAAKKAAKSAPKRDLPPVDKPISIEEFQDLRGRLSRGEATADEMRHSWERYKANPQLIESDLGKLKKADLMKYGGMHVRSSDKKAEMVKSAVDSIESTFAPGSLSYSMGEMTPAGSKAARHKAIDKAVKEWTDESIQKSGAERKARFAATVKAVKNPETLDEFRTFVMYKGEKSLTPEQKRTFEDLQTESSKGQRSVQAARKADVAPTKLENTEFSYSQEQHTKKGTDIHVVKMSNRVDRDKYDELNIRAKKLGGYYSKWSKGFIFDDKDGADKFMSLDRVSGEEKHAHKQEDSKSRAADRIQEQADRLKQSSEEDSGRDRLANTARRASMASSAEGAARGNLNLATTMHNTAEAIRNNDVKFIDRLSTKADFVQMTQMVNAAQYAYSRTDAISKLPYREREHERERPARDSDIDHAEYPYPYLHKENLQKFALSVRDKPGLKLQADRMLKKVAALNGEDQHLVRFKSPTDIEDLRGFLTKAHKALGGDRYDDERRKQTFSDYDRLQKLDIKSPTELKSALREYLQYRGDAAKADPIKAMERDLVGKKIDGYFPTPKPLAERLVDEADIKPGMRVLEPSAGKGSLVDAIKQAQPTADVTAIEPYSSLHDILKAKGHNPLREDFLEHKGQYDRIVMNPPFENGQDIDHVRHAYDQLAPGGKMVAIMGEGGFFRGDKKATDFRDWLDNKGVSEKLPEGSFKTSDNPTGVNTRMVTIDKPRKN